VKIIGVHANNRKRAFEVKLRRRTLPFPYARAHPSPTPDDPVREVFPDPDLGNEGFTYLLSSGAEGTIHVDSVLEYNEDPTSIADLVLYRLTTAARERFDASPLSAREVARLLGTSPAQLYRLLDPTNYAKSLRQLIALLSVLGYEVAVEVRDRPVRTAAG